MRELSLVVALAATVAACWLGCLGMWRMPEPTQALHYLSLPAGVGSVFLAVAVFLETTWSSAALKSGLIVILLAAANSVVTHATARAIRVRKLGHWEPRRQDGVEFLKGGTQR
jgi:multisubunit Na+/H+ antiporter MnhG subunit